MCRADLHNSGAELAGRRRRAPLHQDLVDALSKGGVPCEALVAWAAIEAKVLRPTRRASEASGGKCSSCGSTSSRRSVGEELMPLQARDAVVRFLMHLVEHLGMAPSTWFDAVLLLDVYQLRVNVGLEAIPAACAAVVALLRKSDSAKIRVNVASLAAEASQLALWLHNLGFLAEVEVVAETVRAQELAILAALDWRVGVVSVEAWLTSLRARFGIVTSGRVAPTVDWVLQKSIFSARAFLHGKSSCASLSPRQMANGLFCLGLVAARLLPLDALRRDKVEAKEWEKLFVDSQWHGAVEPCALPDEHLWHMLDTLEVATGCSLSVLKDDTYAVALAMGDVVATSSRAASCANGRTVQGL